MKLPQAEKAYIPPHKLVDYLLSATHPVGGPKAKFFLAAGFDAADPLTLERRLLELARAGDVTEVEQSPHGVKYVVEGEIQAPSGALARLRTVWIVEVGQGRPRFVTAYPA